MTGTCMFCNGPDRIEVANGGCPSVVGNSAVKDAKGAPVGKRIWEVGSSKGQGFVLSLN